ncbi:MAG: Polynucleotide adenylyltransferase/metal dependent phosphohydrolase [Parcubacteria group bacterium GW2011_GWA1_49_11]|nr:MAG: Polynucleotide adenylyltransferase/metal dependent phosphohydrolase [Parcubacteria group bacterium GW2011_GWA1_49_11]
MSVEKTKHKFEIPEEVKDISRALSVAGFENFLVGGCVRDLVRQAIYGEPVEPKDWDIATSAKPEEIIGLFPKTFYENEYGTVGVVNEQAGDKTLKVIEVTPYRLESGYSDFRRPDKVEWGKTIEDDLARRDFSMNALAYNVETGELLDPFGGKADIEKKLIRTVGLPEERFSEDALRMFRALRLSSELNFAIEHETQKAITKHAELLEHISRERVRDEFTKIIMSDVPALAFDLAARLGLLNFISPEFEKGIGVEQNQAHAYTVWEHLLRTLNHAAKKNFPLHVRLAAFAHDVAKPHTRKWLKGQWTFYNHEVLGARLARVILTDLRFSKEIIEKVVKLVRWHMFFSDTEKITLSAVRRIVRNVGTDLIWDLVDLRICDRIGTGRPKETPFRLRKYKSMIEEVLRDPISVKQLKINGADIMKLTGAVPGPHIGFVLEILLSEVLDNPELNSLEYLENRIRELHALKPEELLKLGKAARAKNASEEEKEIEKIREEYKVQ